MKGINQKELLNYCKSEMSKHKYDKAEMESGFSDLVMTLSVALGSDDFISKKADNYNLNSWLKLKLQIAQKEKDTAEIRKITYSEKTLAMFRQVIDKYAQNTGREIYERIVKLFAKMVKINGGNEIVRDMISQYQVLYKNRKAMMEIINKF